MTARVGVMSELDLEKLHDYPGPRHPILPSSSPFQLLQQQIQARLFFFCTKEREK